MENAGKNLWKMQVIEFVSKEDLQVMESVSINHSCYNFVYHQLRVICKNVNVIKFSEQSFYTRLRQTAAAQDE